jgi:competence protein ComEA
MLKKISRKLNLTLTELRVTLFMLAVLIAGFILKQFKDSGDESPYKEFDYSIQDSLFEQYTKKDSSEMDKDAEGTDVDYKHEVLDFNERKFEKTEPKILPQERSIDINKAGVELLKTLPGIGEKTANNIIALRDKRGRFKTVDELLEVKGIGNSKFNKIKKFIFIGR